MKTIFKSKRGAALAVVMIVFAVVAIVGTTIVTTSLAQVQSSVAVEKMTADYALAQSYVEVLTSDVLKEIEKVYDAKENLESAITAFSGFKDVNGEPTEDNIDTYGIDKYNEFLQYAQNVEQELADFEAANKDFNDYKASLLLGVKINIPTIGERSLNIYDNTINSQLAQLEVSCTVNNSTARADVKYSFSKDTGEITYDTFDPQEHESAFFDYAMYSWGELYPNANFSGNSEFGHVAALNGIDPKYLNKLGNDINGKPNVIVVADKQDMPILKPPSTLPHFDSNSFLNNENVMLTNLNSGYYDGVLIDNKKAVWKVNTEADDVILVFDTFNKNNVILEVTDLKILVYGKHNLYIYLKEPYKDNTIKSNRLLHFRNGKINFWSADINWNVLPNDPVKTYIIAYNDQLQAFGDSTLIPYKDVPTGNFDDILIETGSGNEEKNRLAAFFYTPGCKVSLLNNNNNISSLYASEIYFANGNYTFHYEQFPPDSALIKDTDYKKTITYTYTAANIKIVYPNPIITYDRDWKK